MKEKNDVLADIKLRFNLEHPNVEDCYVLGYECAKEDLQESANPFKEGSLESDYWQEGWWAGFYNEVPLFELSEHQEAIESRVQEEKPNTLAANDSAYQEQEYGFFRKIWEITGVIAVSALVGYQVIDLVA